MYLRHNCNETPSPSKNKATVIAISIVVPVLGVVVLILVYFIWREKRKRNCYTPSQYFNYMDIDISFYNTWPSQYTHTPQTDSQHAIPTASAENRQFRYKELEKITNNFKQFIGQGGFGLVYYGRLEDATEVAVKMRSESSSHGLDEFLAEVPN